MRTKSGAVIEMIADNRFRYRFADGASLTIPIEPLWNGEQLSGILFHLTDVRPSLGVQQRALVEADLRERAVQADQTAEFD
jgi:hypothetical protein